MRLRDRLTKAEIAFLLDLYDGEVRHTDRGIGRLLETLSRLDLTDETLVVVTADHGEEFMEHGWVGHTVFLYDTLIRVPLIIRPARFDGDARVVEGAVSLVSLAPTILDLVGLDPVAYDFQGRSFAAHLAGGAPKDERVIFAEVDYEQHPKLRSRKRAVIAHPFRLIEDGLSGEVELFDVVSDRGERHDLAAERADVARSLREELAALGDSAEHPGQPAPEVTQEAREMLRGLGYVE
jgi:arylsulfatase A-like enzyme